MTGDKTEFIKPPVDLKAKAGPVTPGVDEAALARAEQAIAAMAEDYIVWAEEDIKKLKVAVADVRAQAPDDRKDTVDAVFGLAHDMKGQGGSFGFPLITAVANQMCRFIENSEDSTFTDAHVNILAVHADALNLILSKKIKGDGGRAGDDLLSGLQAVIDKIAPKKD